LGVRDRIECGHADCPSVSPGVAVSGKSDIGGFFGGSTTVCGRCSLRVAGLILLLGALAACFGISAGGIRRVSGAYPSSSSPSPVKFTGSNHWKMLTFRSSIAAHPARPKPADKVKETSATRAQPPNWYSPSVARVLSGHRVGMDGRVTPHGCRGVNSPHPPIDLPSNTSAQFNKSYGRAHATTVGTATTLYAFMPSTCWS
jgi:hypothetical protein